MATPITTHQIETRSDQNTLKQILNAKEGENIEFKEAKISYHFDDLVKYGCALANCGGGMIVLGVSDQRPRQVVGTNAFKQPERTRMGLMEKLKVGVDFDTYEQGGKRVLVFTIAKRPVGLPIVVNGIPWWRHGDSLVPMPPAEIHKIYEEAADDFSAKICGGATLDDLDEQAINNFRHNWIRKSGNERYQTLTVMQLLTDCQAIVNGEITFAALILFGKQEALMKYLPHCEIIFEYRISNNAGPAQQREEFRIGYFACYEKIWNLINLRNNKQYFQDGLAVLDVLTFNERVSREALLNAITHRNYQLGGSVFIKQYADRLVVENPGGFPHGITEENILNRHSARNRRIAHILSMSGFVERAGQGMNLMYELSIQEAKALPSFSGSDSYYTVLTLNGTLTNARQLQFFRDFDSKTIKSLTTDDYLAIDAIFNKKVVSDGLKNNVVKLFTKGILNDRFLERDINNLTKSQKAIFMLIIENGSISADTLANQLEITPKTVKTALRIISEHNLVKRFENAKEIVVILEKFARDDVQIFQNFPLMAKNFQNVPENDTKFLTKSQRAVLKLIDNDSALKPAEMASQLHLSVKTVTNALKNLSKYNLIFQHKNKVYQLSKRWKNDTKNVHNVPQNDTKELTKSQVAVLALIKKNNSLTNDAIAKELILGIITVKRATKVLSERGFIKRHGDRKSPGGFWEITEAN